MGAGALWTDRLTGKSGVGENEQDGVQAGEGYTLLAVRKDQPGSLAQTTGDLVPLKVTKTGELWIGGSSILVGSSNGTGVVASGTKTLITAPNPGMFIRVHALQACNQGPQVVLVTWLDSILAIKNWAKALTQNGEFQRIFSPNFWDLPDGAGLQFNLDVAPAGSGLQWCVEYEIIRTMA